MTGLLFVFSRLTFDALHLSKGTWHAKGVNGEALGDGSVMQIDVL